MSTENIVGEYTGPKRQVICQRCGCEFTHFGRGWCKRCPPCRKANNVETHYKWMVAHGVIKNPGVGSGGDQRGEKNPMWRGGIALYRRIMSASGIPPICNGCGKDLRNSPPYERCVHHINENRYDNNVENLEWMCKACHQAHHGVRDHAGRYTSRTKIAELSEKTRSTGQLEPKAGDTRSGATHTGQGQLAVPISPHEAATPQGENIC